MLHRKINVCDTGENKAILPLEFLAGEITGRFWIDFAQKFSNPLG
jgi:hypothetical protein